MTSLDDKYKSLSTRREALQQSKTRIEAELEARKRALKAHMDAAKKDGFDPNTLREDIKRIQEVLAIKLDNFEAELDEAEQKMKPMLDEIKGS